MHFCTASHNSDKSHLMKWHYSLSTTTPSSPISAQAPHHPSRMKIGPHTKPTHGAKEANPQTAATEDESETRRDKEQDPKTKRMIAHSSKKQENQKEAASRHDTIADGSTWTEMQQLAEFYKARQKALMNAHVAKWNTHQQGKDRKQDDKHTIDDRNKPNNEEDKNVHKKAANPARKTTSLRHNIRL